MNKNNMFKKGQSLPLNTIVIAILVILVLVVIIVFFTTNVGNTGNEINNHGSVGDCNADTNPAIKTLGYTQAQYTEKADCTDRGGNSIAAVSKDEDGNICCGWK